MAKGNEIIVSSPPKGHFMSIIVDGTPKPGTVMTERPGSSVNTSNAGNLWEFEAAGVTAGLMSADGDRIPIAVLDMDKGQGKLATTAYADADVARVYYPVPGEELNVLFLNQSGTADDVALFDKMIVDDGTGQILVTTGSPEAEPFVALEAYTDPTADKLLHCRFTGY